ncbi:MAG: protein-L-isoaspartate O-methyltransferase [Gammaproteobacteria bacterium]|nr:MAG: protein-L-isoaspartate O-methyltransferase [Gammaproteobacteria bacterium]
MSQSNIDIARYNMVEQQIRPWEVLDQKILDLLSGSPRQDYVPDAYKSMAYVDIDIPLGYGQVMMAPKLEARILQAPEIRPDDRILEVGTGSGHLTSLLASLGDHVYSVERVPELKDLAEKNLTGHNITNVTLETGDAANGWDSHEPYDVIVITGSLPSIPEGFRQSLAIGGRMVAIVGRSPVMEVKLVKRIDKDNWTESSLFETDLPPLDNTQKPDSFVF